MDVRHRGRKADRLDARGVREARGAVDQSKPGDRSAVEAEEIQGFVGAIDV
jgi:hypothetical protein